MQRVTPAWQLLLCKTRGGRSQDPTRIEQLAVPVAPFPFSKAPRFSKGAPRPWRFVSRVRIAFARAQYHGRVPRPPMDQDFVLISAAQYRTRPVRRGCSLAIDPQPVRA